MLVWNVIYGNFNSGCIETFNIFDHYGFKNDCAKAAKDHENDKEKFLEKIRRELAYYFMTKCEWEVVVSHWPPSEHASSRFRDRKIDVYFQVILNWDAFADYIWAHRNEL